MFSIFVDVRIVGSAFIILSSIGHGINPTNPIFVVLSMGFICLFTIVPYYVNVKIIGDSDGGAVISTDKDNERGKKHLCSLPTYMFSLCKLTSI